MLRKPKKRTYDSHSRKAAAQITRHSIFTAANKIFLEKGYAAATMAEIAQIAGVALDTVYATVGKKPSLFRLLVERSISGIDRAIPAESRDYVLAIRAEPNATQKLRLYAAALCKIQPRLAPLFRTLHEAAELDPQLAAMWKAISRRRAKNMRLFAADLAATKRLRSGLSIPKTADILWSMNSPEFYILLVEQRRWPLHEFEHWLANTWIQLLLIPSTA